MRPCDEHSVTMNPVVKSNAAIVGMSLRSAPPVHLYRDQKRLRRHIQAIGWQMASNRLNEPAPLLLG